MKYASASSGDLATCQVIYSLREMALIEGEENGDVGEACARLE